MKRRISTYFILVVFFLSLLIQPSVRAQSSDNDKEFFCKRISEMSDQELELFLDNYVEDYRKDPDTRRGMISLLKAFIHQFDSEGETLIPLSYTLYYDWAEKIDKGIEAYYKGLVRKTDNISLKASYSPIQNTFYQVPSNMSGFQCYAYAINHPQSVDPGFFSGNTFNITNTNSSILATYVRDDLKSTSFNQQCVRITPNCPSSSVLSSGMKVICIRWGKRPDNSIYDYHLMKLTSEGWLHKPGKTAIIKHIISHSNSTPWLCEYTYNGITWGNDALNYLNQIYYIVYQQNHNYSLKYTGNHYHSGSFHYYEKAYVCNNCTSSYGEHYIKIACSGPPCSITPLKNENALSPFPLSSSRQINPGPRPDGQVQQHP